MGHTSLGEERRKSAGKKSNSRDRFFPEHENLTVVSKIPLPGFAKSGDFFEEPRGKCLDEIIESRYNTSMHFPENQVVGLLESLVYSLAYLCRKGIGHHDYYPTNIYYMGGVFKLLNPALVACSGYSITQQSKKIVNLGQRFSFLSPELINEILEDRKEG